MSGDGPERRLLLPDVTVIIPTIGRPVIERCLRSILDGTAWPGQLIVVDQQPGPLMADLMATLRELGMDAEHLKTPNERFVAKATNRGFECTSSRFVAITHDDCEVDPNWLVRLAKHLREHPGSIFTGMVKPGEGEGVVPSTITSSVPAVYTKPGWKGGVLYPNNMGCAETVFRRVGPFDEREFLRTAEDNDWSYRALRAGVPIRYVPDVVVTHLDWRTPEQLSETYRSYARSQGGFFGKHLRRFDPHIALLIPIALARAFKRWITGLLKSDPEQVARGRAFLVELVPGILAGLRAQSDS